MTRKYRLQDLKFHFREFSLYYFCAICFLVLGLVLGIYIAFTGYRYTALLSPADRNMFAYITGSASYTNIFYSRLLSILLCIFIVCLLSLSKWTAVLCYAFLSYQMALMVLTCSAVISLYGLSGILNSVLFVVPINLANLAMLCIIANIGVERASYQKRFGLSFKESFSETGYYFKLLLSFCVLLVVCVFHSFVLPLVLKSFIVINI